VGVWEADPRGRLRLLAASDAERIAPAVADDLEPTLRELHVLPRRAPSRWVASRLGGLRWCIAPVRRDAPRPPPAGLERRGRERLTLELVGVCIGLIDEAQSPDVESVARLALILDQVPAILWTTDVELRVISRAGAGLKSQQILPDRIVGASLLEQQSLHKVGSESVAAHRRALAGESVSYQIRLFPRCYDAHVEPLRDEGGAIVGVVGLAVDVSDREQALAQAHRSQAELDEFFENAPVGIRWTAPEGTILRANRSELDLLGYQPDEYLGRNIAQFCVDPEVAVDSVRRLVAGETVRNVDIRMRHRDGSIRHGLLSANALFESGQLIHARCVTRDITDRIEAEQALAEFKAMVESADDAVIGKTLEGIITKWNPAATRLYGYAADEVIGKPIAVLAPADRVDEFAGILERLRRGEHIEHFDTTRVRKDGTSVEVSITISPILDSDGRPVGATTIARDITARKRAEQQLLHEALHDALTDLPNRAYFVERVSQALARLQRDRDYRFALLFIDLDDFKAANDRLGHVAGDRLLTEIAARLRTCVRPGDVVARLGGDEFTVLLEEITGLPEGERAARRIQDALAVPVSLEGQDVVATASIGVVLSGPHYTQPQELLHDADLAMYHAKERGRARFQVFDIAMRDSAQARLGMEADLRNALERNELRLVFQPIVQLETGNVHAFEALLRWHRPEQGVVLPPELLPLAEQAGHILPIGAWVLQEACRCARRWQDALPASAPLRVHVNLSAKQLGHPGIVDEVRTALREAGLSPSCLALEISESVLMASVESSAALLLQLRELGVDLHMDDFGIGYSSLSHLPRLPLQGIKVDRSLVHRIGGRRIDLDIMRSIVDLARNLGVEVIAEGVETVAQRERLIAFGCELGQGYLFAKPLEPAAATALLAQSAQADRHTA
jgi:diguanylate cyclase (GGDEF)-like protein/PAS domain S-box-containing protein